MCYRICDNATDADREATIANHMEHAKRYYDHFMDEAKDLMIVVEMRAENNPDGLKEFLPDIYYVSFFSSPSFNDNLARAVHEGDLPLL